MYSFFTYFFWWLWWYAYRQLAQYKRLILSHSFNYYQRTYFLSHLINTTLWKIWVEPTGRLQIASWRSRNAPVTEHVFPGCAFRSGEKGRINIIFSGLGKEGFSCRSGIIRGLSNRSTRYYQRQFFICFIWVGICFPKSNYTFRCTSEIAFFERRLTINT